MAKLPKWPKQPKASASEQTWKNYEDRVKVVAAKRKAIREAPKKKAAIKSRIQSLKAKS